MKVSGKGMDAGESWMLWQFNYRSVIEMSSQCYNAILCVKLNLEQHPTRTFCYNHHRILNWYMIDSWTTWLVHASWTAAVNSRQISSGSTHTFIALDGGQRNGSHPWLVVRVKRIEPGSIDTQITPTAPEAPEPPKAQQVEMGPPAAIRQRAR